ncbi:hypothetical protein ACFRJ1_12105 [Streptomyces sp. NPDC056773]|uniref:hypothetical protein n=1 Tax=unclassified Streptomyces TaxID=2593676 RepID=UPI0036B03F2E
MAPRSTFLSAAPAKAAVALAMTALTLFAAPGVAGAASAPDAARSEFSAQARAAGLDAGQAKSLQKRVDSYLGKEKGKQVAVNKITLDEGAEILLTLPGEKYAREVGAPKIASAAAASEYCAYTYVCAFESTWFQGDKKTLFTCNTLNYIPWSGTGSWINNQRAALRAKFYRSDQTIGWISPGGYSEDGQAPWGWVYWLSPC